MKLSEARLIPFSRWHSVEIRLKKFINVPEIVSESLIKPYFAPFTEWSRVATRAVAGAHSGFLNYLQDIR
jgi:hypothetical protein